MSAMATNERRVFRMLRKRTTAGSGFAVLQGGQVEIGDGIWLPKEIWIQVFKHFSLGELLYFKSVCSGAANCIRATILSADFLERPNPQVANPQYPPSFDECDGACDLHDLLLEANFCWPMSCVFDFSYGEFQEIDLTGKIMIVHELKVVCRDDNGQVITDMGEIRDWFHKSWDLAHGGGEYDEDGPTMVHSTWHGPEPPHFILREDHIDHLRKCQPTVERMAIEVVGHGIFHSMDHLRKCIGTHKMMKDRCAEIKEERRSGVPQFDDLFALSNLRMHEDFEMLMRLVPFEKIGKWTFQFEHIVLKDLDFYQSSIGYLYLGGRILGI